MKQLEENLYFNHSFGVCKHLYLFFCLFLLIHCYTLSQLLYLCTRSHFFQSTQDHSFNNSLSHIRCYLCHLRKNNQNCAYLTERILTSFICYPLQLTSWKFPFSIRTTLLLEFSMDLTISSRVLSKMHNVFYVAKVSGEFSQLKLFNHLEHMKVSDF